MERWMGGLGRMGKGRFYLALGYLIWSLLPHFHVYWHSHRAGAHAHAGLSPQQVRLANQLVDGLGPAGLTAQEADFGGEGRGPDPACAPAGPGVSADFGAAGLASLLPLRGDPDRHAHFWADPNVAGLVSETAVSFSASVLASPAGPGYRDPCLRAPRRPMARGPPAFLPA